MLQCTSVLHIRPASVVFAHPKGDGSKNTNPGPAFVIYEVIGSYELFYLRLTLTLRCDVKQASMPMV